MLRNSVTASVVIGPGRMTRAVGEWTRRFCGDPARLLGSAVEGGVARRLPPPQASSGGRVPLTPFFSGRKIFHCNRTTRARPGDKITHTAPHRTHRTHTPHTPYACVTNPRPQQTDHVTPFAIFTILLRAGRNLEA
jgi:hypothetical protein